MKSFWKHRTSKTSINTDDKYRFLIETATDAIYLVDCEGHIVDTNSAAEKMLGLSRSTLLNSSLSDIDTNFSKSTLLEFWDKLPFNEQKIFTTTHKRSDGSFVPVEISGKKFKYNDDTLFYGIARDISERVLAAGNMDEQTKKFELLSLSATEMLELPDLKSIYSYICQTIHKRYPKSLVMVVAVDEKLMLSSLREASGLEDSLLRKLMDVVGFDPFKKAYRIIPGHYAIWKSGMFHAYPGGLKEFSAGEFPAMGIRVAQQLFNLHKIYTIGINKGEQLVSAVHVITRDKNVIVEHDFVDSFVKQAGIIIQRKLFEDELRFQSLILDQIHDRVTVTDLQGTITYVNKAEVDMMQRPAHELIGQNVTVYGENTDNPHSQQQIIDNTLKHGTWRGEVVNHTPDGQETVLDVRTQLLYNVNSVPVGMVGISTDITTKKLVEEELLRAKENAEESDRMKTAFLANISHEIRTPMNGILGFLDLMKEPMTSDEKREDYLRIVQESGKRLMDTIDDIMAASRIEAGEVDLNLVNTDLRDLLCFLYDFYSVQASMKGISMILEPENHQNSLLIKTDVSKLNSILTNLLKNSIKFTETGQIRFGYTKEENLLSFFVEDTGIGIPDDHHQSIFKRFVQSDLRLNRSYEGSGLGLSIAKAYVEMLGGTIWLNSKLGKGTTIHFTLPLNL